MRETKYTQTSTSPKPPAPAQQGEEDAQVQARPCVPAEQDNKREKRTTNPQIGIRVDPENSLGRSAAQEQEQDSLNEYMVRRVMHLNREEDNSKGEQKISAAMGGWF